MGKCKYCGKESKGTYCSFNCAGMDEKYNGVDYDKIIPLKRIRRRK